MKAMLYKGKRWATAAATKRLKSGNLAWHATPYKNTSILLFLNFYAETQVAVLRTRPAAIAGNRIRLSSWRVVETMDRCKVSGSKAAL
jgi:hypothetical protein